MLFCRDFFPLRWILVGWLYFHVAVCLSRLLCFNASFFLSHSRRDNFSAVGWGDGYLSVGNNFNGAVEEVNDVLWSDRIEMRVFLWSLVAFLRSVGNMSVRCDLECASCGLDYVLGCHGIEFFPREYYSSCDGWDSFEIGYDFNVERNNLMGKWTSLVYLVQIICYGMDLSIWWTNQEADLIPLLPEVDLDHSHRSTSTKC